MDNLRKIAGMGQDAPNINTPKSSRGKRLSEEKKALPEGEEGRKELNRVRKRLSVVSSNTLVDGVEDLNLAEEKENVKQGGFEFIVSTFAGISKKGYSPYNPHKRNQDALIMEEDAATLSLFLAVLDGHGEFGDAVSQFFQQRLTNRLFRHEAWSRDVFTACREVIAQLEEELLTVSGIDAQFSGTTFCACVIRNNTAYVVNIGDSRACLGRRSPDGSILAVPLSRDHKPDEPDEQQRIEETGGRVFAIQYDDGVEGPPRVWLSDADIPGLAMSRSLGDLVAHTAGVSSEPECSEHALDSSTDCFLILGSDGLWEFVENQEVVDVLLEKGEPSTSISELLKISTNRWMKEEEVVDDTTICVSFLSGFRG
jgi:serine/threonine protein phosphatase PrpC